MRRPSADAYDLSLSGPMEIIDIAVVLVAIMPRHQHFDVLPNDLACRIFEKLLACGVEHQNYAERVDENDAIDRGLDHGAQPSCLRIARLW